MYTIVIIDDEKWVIKSLLATLSMQNDFQIIGEAYNGIDGFKLIKNTIPDIAFIDIKMPGLGGLELLKNLNEINCPTLCIIISGHAEFAYAQKALENNAIGYCLKPFSATEINENLFRATTFLTKQKASHSSSPQLKPPSDFARYTTNKIVQNILFHIHERYTENLSIQLIARLCNVNANYASQLFNQEMKVSFSHYLSLLRINEAKQLLKNTDLSISTIALTIGYQDYFYFAKVFKKITGTTPTKFRKETIL
jgi:Response regulator containing CheY-like receiver domain and AraC-type DNA-binding domain